ncbi:MAG TPA: hypothetical protein VFM44_12055, partial [Gemmatimonadota bacterium]|nr:hypothetical protein [Gemmatimonadota bacterium]
RSIEAGTSTDFWERLESRIWPEGALTVVDGGQSAGLKVGRWHGPAVGLAAAAVLALFVFVRGFGPDSASRTLGPQRVQASVVMTVPEVPEEPATLAQADTQDRTAGESRSPSRSREWTRVSAEPADPEEAMLVRADSRATTGFDREIRRLRERVFEGSIGRDRMRTSLSTAGWVEDDGWVAPVRLGGDWARSSIRPAALVRPISAVMPAPWNVDQAVSLP